MKDLTDFAVIVRGASVFGNQSKIRVASNLRVIPLADAPSMSNALSGNVIEGLDIDRNMPRTKSGAVLNNVRALKHSNDGYTRIVAELTGNAGTGSGEGSVALPNASGFALLSMGAGNESADEVLAVASTKSIVHIGSRLFVSFTFVETNNFQKVMFSPNAFATIEDLDEINGLDGLHIDFNEASGDIRLLDKEGNVIDQANLHIKSDTIIAEGEEDFKYVKTDRVQDIHAEKAFMPAGMTAGSSVSAQSYEPVEASVIVANGAVQGIKVKGSENDKYYVIGGENEGLDKTQGNDEGIAGGLVEAQAPATVSQFSSYGVGTGTLYSTGTVQIIESTASYTKVRVTSNPGYEEWVGREFYVSNQGEGRKQLYNDAALQDGEQVEVELTNSAAAAEMFDKRAFVLTLQPAMDASNGDLFALLNNHMLALGFHPGDDVPLGDNIDALIEDLRPESGAPVDPDAYLHSPENAAAVASQRGKMRSELAAWNAQHPALVQDKLNGTRISESGLDVRNGSLQIGNGGVLGDSVKRYEIDTDIDSVFAGDHGKNEGLNITRIDSQAGNNDIEKNVLTINDTDYISGAPTCLALLLVTVEGGLVKAGEVRSTSRFHIEGSEGSGNSANTFSLTITDNRAGMAIGEEARIVEIIPVHKDGADANEAVPSLQPITCVKAAGNSGTKTLTVQCSRVLDWKASIGDQDALYLVVKVY